MKFKKYSIGIVVLLLIPGITFLFFATPSQITEVQPKYPDYVGKIDLNKATRTTEFSLCKDENKPHGFYSSSAPHIYKKNKLEFREFIVQHYQNRNRNDNGYLNLRFHINCRGETGNLIINELNADLEPSNLSATLVEQLVDLSMRNENWRTADHPTINYYMYLIFKIENGNVTEILP
ncbi:hypothetical protein [Aquimarina celericrescens]|uniref:TonB C-terminal domain-containing protein n=1 Tax=Aquimarina celericrescens TaxID=1964542 RepID=A0ABW5ATA5_9FLAO|nr:hypothetical protein [Aquimarina celericrescens]